MNNIPSIMKHYSAKWLLFTDLDGTLLDRRYDLKGAADAMDSLHQHGCLCVPASSKTHLEMVELSTFRKFPSPYIFENGGGLSWPSAREPELIGRSAEEISGLLDHIRDEHLFKFRLFRDISVVEIAGRTGLTEASARRAKARQASMPLIWTDTRESLERFREILGFIGLQVVSGGLFQTVLDKRCSKAAAMLSIAEEFNRGECRPGLVACGDAENDLEMMAIAGTAILFPNKAGQYVSFDHPRLHFAPSAGHEQWLQSLQHVLALQSNKVALEQRRTEYTNVE
jgi:mannosyl-3-phosphoglycerate phosphatase family protein